MLKPQYNESRESFDLDGFWDFVPGRNEERPDVALGLEQARQVAVPGSWNEQCLDLYNHFGEGWYEKRFFISRGWLGRRIFIHFGSVCQDAEVWLNGVRLGGHS
ncbi:MAG TPA: hypothetical protein DEA90_05440 [Opitutae bacterium]|nr:hypothetical protein [Puniceicoccaceae bacterium]HBR93591.1 hypothetical protein [Opitutae bacterium]|tara:strand:+ start:3875 stop:4186 length:312 start_codon:yes stop_codon:yes gene_type:complete